VRKIFPIVIHMGGMDAMSETGGAGRPIATAVRAVRGEGVDGRARNRGWHRTSVLFLRPDRAAFSAATTFSRSRRRRLVVTSRRTGHADTTARVSDHDRYARRSDHPATRPPRSIRRRDARAPIADVVFQIDSNDPPLSPSHWSPYDRVGVVNVDP
jgi:hypothetical protein